MRDQLSDYINKVLEFYEALGADRVSKDHFHSQGGYKEWVFPRLQRAAFDQIDNGCCATDSRYAIWAADVKEILLEAESHLEQKDIELAIRNINLAINALSAYIDIKSLFDSDNGMRFNTPDEIISRYKK